MSFSPHWIDAVIALTLLEGLSLWWWWSRRGRGLPARDFAYNWVSGLCLIAALRGAVAGWGMAWVLGWLTVSGLVHALDLRRRWR